MYEMYENKKCKVYKHFTTTFRKDKFHNFLEYDIHILPSIHIQYDSVMDKIDNNIEVSPTLVVEWLIWSFSIWVEKYKYIIFKEN